MKKKKVSVIIPVYKCEEYLKKCLDSVLIQSFQDFEIIVVNDGSPDNSQKIIDDYVSKFPSIIKGYKKANGGLSSARNFGLKYATGDYILFLDSDDYLKENMIKSMYEKAIKDDSDIVICDTIVTDGNNEYILKSNLKYSDDNIRNYIISYPMVCIRLIKKEFFETIKFKEGIFYEDLETMPKLAMLTNKITFTNEATYYYLQREGSITSAKKEYNSKILDIFEVLDSVEKFYEKYGNLELYKEEIEYLYITHILRSTTLRLLDCKNSKKVKNNLEKINKIMYTKFPMWRKNTYYSKSTLKFKLVCNLAYNKHYKLLTYIKKISNK